MYEDKDKDTCKDKLTSLFKSQNKFIKNCRSSYVFAILIYAVDKRENNPGEQKYQLID